jgi:hypothetical protein
MMFAWLSLVPLRRREIVRSLAVLLHDDLEAAAIFNLV